MTGKETAPTEAGADPTNTKQTQQSLHPHDNAGRQILHDLKRRRAAARRIPLLNCGRHSDPWTCRCHDGPPSVKMTDAAREAGEYLLSHGLTPLLDFKSLGELYRRGGDDREAAVRLARMRQQ
jgi:hypothetical protein